MAVPYTWKIVYRDFRPQQEGLRETLCALGNGYFVSRGAAPEAVASRVHYPGTYIAGLYNRLTSRIAGRTVVNEDLVNCPNWLFLTFRIEDEDWFCPSTSKIISYYQELNLREGSLFRKIIFEDWQKRKTLITSTMLVSMANPHIGVLFYEIKPLNYQGYLTVGTMLDGSVINSGVERYRELNSKHLRPKELGNFSGQGIYLLTETSSSKIEIAQASKLRVFLKKREIFPQMQIPKKGREIIGQEFKVFVEKGNSLRIEKSLAMFTSKDQDIKESALSSAISLAQKIPGFKRLASSQKRVWEKLWDICDIEIKGDTFSQKILRLHIFHLLQTASLHNLKIDAGLPARGWHGEAYRGHIFWDSAFSLHFYDLHLPRVARALLLYRYRRISSARRYARRYGYKGAMFPWQSASSGREETQIFHLNPLSGEWGPDYSCQQRHVSFAIAYNVYKHYLVTGSYKFLASWGGELFLSIAQFAGSLCRYSRKDGRYHTQGLMGPDEFHEKYPQARKPGLRDNAYSNFMIVWILTKAKEILEILSEEDKRKLLRKLKINSKDLERWEDITKKMNIIVNKRGIIEQFEGYFKLKDIDWQSYKLKYRNISRMDRILRAEGKSPDEYKVTKQADVLMIFYLFSFKEVLAIFKRLGFDLDLDKIRKNYDYYAKRTTHGSSLSKVAHCLVAKNLGRSQEAWKWLIEVLEADFYDTQGGTTPEGIHTGVMGGSIDLVLRGFAGLNFQKDKIEIKPSLPRKWKKITFNFLFRRVGFKVSIDRRKIKIQTFLPWGKILKIPVEVNGSKYYLLGGKVFTLSYP
ncbi:MAG: glycoside hydrolase family 65 protein [Candidatus Omnitrophota bacterium]|nr:MAG: glycoside hydrolase family 65 protein [Candidatus Omnitrophota bacterium]